MFRCNSCHTEYGGIRGVTADVCPRCRDREAAQSMPTTAVASFAGPSRDAGSSWSLPTLPLVGEIARLDRAVRF
jgi:hypothetical protein